MKRMTNGRYDLLYLRDVPARELGMETCGPDSTDAMYRCTKPKGHEGDHGQPNWDGHLEVAPSHYLPGFEFGVRSSHDYRMTAIRSREEAEAVIAFLREQVDAYFPVEAKP